MGKEQADHLSTCQEFLASKLLSQDWPLPVTPKLASAPGFLVPQEPTIALRGRRGTRDAGGGLIPTPIGLPGSRNEKKQLLVL